LNIRHYWRLTNLKFATAISEDCLNAFGFIEPQIIGQGPLIETLSSSLRLDWVFLAGMTMYVSSAYLNIALPGVTVVRLAALTT